MQKDGLIVGLDIAIHNTGWCYSCYGEVEFGTYQPKDKTHLERLCSYITWFDNGMPEYSGPFLLHEAELIIVEDYTHQRNSKATSKLGEQRGIFYNYLFNVFTKIPDNLVFVSQGTLKKFGTGKGNTIKDMVPAMVERKYPGIMFNSTHECEAFVLAKMGEAVLQWELASQIQDKPPCTFKKYEIEAICAVEKFREMLDVDARGNKV